MNVLKRNLTLLVLIGTPLVCGVVTAVKFQENVTRQNRNATLIVAIEADKNAEAIRLLASGADANSRELPEDTRTFWQKLREIWRPVKRDEPLYPSALTLALRRALVAENPDTIKTRFQIIKALHDAGAVEDGKLAPPQTKLQDAEEQIKYARDTPVGSNYPIYSLYDSDDALKYILQEWGMSARVMADFAECQFREEKYREATRAYRIAVLWRPADAGLQTCLAQAEEYSAAAETIQKTLPAGRSVFSVRPYPVYGLPGSLATLRGASSGAWIAVCGIRAGNDISAARAALYQWNGVGFQEDCHTPVLRHRWNENDSFSEINLSVFPLTRRATPEIVLIGTDYVSASPPTQVEAFTCEGRRFTRIASVANHAQVEAEKTPQGTRYVITNFYTTGLMKTEYDRAWRSDYYAFDGKRFVFADAQYPKDRRDYIEAAEKALHDYPGDYDLRQNLASLYSIAGRPQKAERYYRKAERDCRKAIANMSEEDAYDCREILAQIVARDPERNF